MTAFVDDPAVAELNEAVQRLDREVHFRGGAVPEWRKRWDAFAAQWRRALARWEASSISPTEGRVQLDRYGERFQRFDAQWEALQGGSAPDTRADDLGTTKHVPPIPAQPQSGVAIALLVMIAVLAWGRR